MKKELIICIIILILIIIGNILTQKYTTNSVDVITESLKDLRKDILKDIENADKEYTLKKVNEVDEKWHKFYNLLAYYIEHNELEKAETNLIAIESYLEGEEYGEGVSKIDETIFVLEHIERKYKVTLQNIF